MIGGEGGEEEASSNASSVNEYPLPVVMTIGEVLDGYHAGVIGVVDEIIVLGGLN